MSNLPPANPEHPEVLAPQIAVSRLLRWSNTIPSKWARNGLVAVLLAISSFAVWSSVTTGRLGQEAIASSVLVRPLHSGCDCGGCRRVVGTALSLGTGAASATSPYTLRCMKANWAGQPRTLLADRFEQALRLGRRQGSTTRLLLIDLDRFKEVNDTLGTISGIVILTKAASAVSAPALSVKLQSPTFVI